jgi:hypothetical protein
LPRNRFFSCNFCFWWPSSWWAPPTIKIMQTHHNMLTSSHVDYITSVESKEVSIPEEERLNFSQWEKSAIRRFLMFIIHVQILDNHWNRPFQPIKSLRLSVDIRKLPKKWCLLKNGSGVSNHGSIGIGAIYEWWHLPLLTVCQPYTQSTRMMHGPPHSYFTSMPQFLTSFHISPATLSHTSTLPAPNGQSHMRSYQWVALGFMTTPLVL